MDLYLTVSKNKENANKENELEIRARQKACIEHTTDTHSEKTQAPRQQTETGTFSSMEVGDSIE